MSGQIIDRYWEQRGGSERIEYFQATGLAPPESVTIAGPQTSPTAPTLVDYGAFLQVNIPPVSQVFTPYQGLAQAAPTDYTANFNASTAEQNRLITYLGAIPYAGPVIEKGIDMAREVLELVKGAVGRYLGTDGNTEVVPTQITGAAGDYNVGEVFDAGEGKLAVVPGIGALTRILPGVTAAALGMGIARTRLIRMIVAALGIMTIEEAADHFGLSISEIARAWIYGKTPRRRRGRGISAADMRRTRSTLSKVSRINCLIKKGSRPTRCC